MTGCENDIFLVIGPSTERIARSIPNIVSNLKKDQVWLYVQNMINLTVIRQTDNAGEHFLEVSLHDVDSFWENTNDEYYAQNKENIGQTLGGFLGNETNFLHAMAQLKSFHILENSRRVNWQNTPF